MIKKLKARFRKKGKQPKPPTTDTGPVTDQSLEHHRKQIFAKGRKFIYPINISKRHIVRNSIIVALALVVLSVGALSLSIYRYQSENDLVYRISRIIPFPAARVNGDFVSYGEYLFLLRSNKTFLESDADSQFSSGELVGNELRLNAFQSAKQMAVLKQLARQHSINVTSDEINEQIAALETFSGGERRLNDIIHQYYGIQISELKILLRTQLLKQKLAPRVSEAAKSEIDDIRKKLLEGEDFEDLAVERSEDDETSMGGGVLGTVSIEEGEIHESLALAGLQLEVGEFSEVIESPEGFHIVTKLSEQDDGVAELAHIMIRYDNLDEYLDVELEEASVTEYIKL